LEEVLVTVLVLGGDKERASLDEKKIKGWQVTGLETDMGRMLTMVLDAATGVESGRAERTGRRKRKFDNQ
jgi:hypothetical protein